MIVVLNVAELVVLAYVAVVLTCLVRAVLADTDRAVDYRTDVLALQAGVFRRLGRDAVLARSNGKRERRRNDQAETEDLSHDLRMRVGADS